jgi:hypothetical protein
VWAALLVLPRTYVVRDGERVYGKTLPRMDAIHSENAGRMIGRSESWAARTDPPGSSNLDEPRRNGKHNLVRAFQPLSH